MTLSEHMLACQQLLNPLAARKRSPTNVWIWHGHMPQVHVPLALLFAPCLQNFCTSIFPVPFPKIHTAQPPSSALLLSKVPFFLQPPQPQQTNQQRCQSTAEAPSAPPAFPHFQNASHKQQKGRGSALPPYTGINASPGRASGELLCSEHRQITK